MSFSSVGKKISNHKKAHRLMNMPDILYFVMSPEIYSFSPLSWIHQVRSSSGFCVGGFFLQILHCSFQLCVQGAHYSCLPLCSSPTSVMSHVIWGCPPLLPLAVQWLHFPRLLFGLFSFSTDLFFFSYLCHFLLPSFRPSLACQKARVRLTGWLYCPQEGFLTASCEPHISNW